MVQGRPDVTAAPPGAPHPTYESAVLPSSSTSSLVDGDQAAQRPPLDLHEGPSDPTPSELPGEDGRYPDQAAERLPLGKHEELGTRCTCGPVHLRLRSDQGELVKPRGGCVNQCDYCAKLAAVENCEMVVSDALEGDAPQLVAILGTRTSTLDMTAFKRGRQEVTRAVRKRWPDAEYVYEVEFTTGYGPRAGGRRRPHWNWFWKGIPRHDWTVASWVIVTAWCQHVDAEPHAQYVHTIDNAVGLTKYVTEHFMKASQRPPKGFTGQRFCASKGYFGEISVQTARARARESLRRGRELWKAIERGLDAHEAELAAHEAYADSLNTVWVLTNERGARVGATGHDSGRMLLPSDRGPVQPAPRSKSYERARLMRRLKLVDRWAYGHEPWRDELRALLADLEAGSSIPPVVEGFAARAPQLR
jgi:hypothetical protein